MEKLNQTQQQKHAFTNQKKCTTTQNKHKKLKPGFVAFYDIWPGNGAGIFSKEYLNKQNLFPTFQSAYRRFHSTETSILKLACDALLATDRGEVTLLGFLDLSAAFVTVDHDILLDHLQVIFGF